jgi:endonuclease YncB( thermonuclease family)
LTTHNFDEYPELSNKQLQEMPFDSPHKQITEDFNATVVKVHDGDTITLRWDERDFDFPLRFLGIDAPEMNAGGEVSRDWLRGKILGNEVQIRITPVNRVDKYGRLLGRVIYNGMDVGEEEIYLGLAKPFTRRYEGQLPNINKEMMIEKWF